MLKTCVGAALIWSKKMLRSEKNCIESKKRWWQSGLMGALAVMVLLTIPQPAAALGWPDWLEDLAEDAVDLGESLFEKTVDGTVYVAKKTVAGTVYFVKKTPDRAEDLAEITVDGTVYVAKKTVAGTVYVLKEAVDYYWDYGDSLLNLTWNVITLDPENAWEDIKDIVNNFVCGEELTVVSIIIGNGLEADFDECDIPPHAIDMETLDKLRHYFKSDFNSVRIHEDCNLDADLIPGSRWENRIAITFGEHIYFKPGVYNPTNAQGLAKLAHELTHVLQYRKKGFSDFMCEYGLNCYFGADRSCDIEQDAEELEARVLADQNRGGLITCEDMKHGYRIDAPGQYRLTEDCPVEPGVSPLSIGASDVDLNLNGYTISGPGLGCVGDTTIGIAVGESDDSNVHIHNGTVTGFWIGIQIAGADNHANGLTMTGNCEGMRVAKSNNNHIYGNNASGNVLYGVLINESNDNNFNSNVVKNTGGLCCGGGGFFLVNSHGNVINSNDMSDNQGNPGLRLRVSRGNIIKDNTANRNSFQPGITIDGDGSMDNFIQGNTALDNHPDSDLADGNILLCLNTWKSNTFGTDNEVGPNSGLGAGCIQ